MKTVSGNIIDIENRRIFSGELSIDGARIVEIRETPNVEHEHYILPGFVDAHIHIESSMLPPSEFARLAVTHGTVATVSDPHEIANVVGLGGVLYMIEDGETVPFKFYFGAPSCVPATTFETAGATLGLEELDILLQRNDVKYLAEMMNWPGVLNRNEEVMVKIALAQKHNKPIDGHAPGLKGEDAINYISAGISTDHECFTKEEALDKLNAGMKVLIREGSAAKNYAALSDLIPDHYQEMMFCSDDKHPDQLILFHIDELVRRSIKKGYDLFHVLQMACINPVKHYNLEVGLLKVGDQADFIVVNNTTEFKVFQTYIDGQLVAENGITKINRNLSKTTNQFNTALKQETDFRITTSGNKMPIIVAEDGQLITKKAVAIPRIIGGFTVSDPSNDVLKIVVVNRYKNAPPAVSFIKNIGIKKGAFASTVAHDSHNIIAVGVTDKELTRAVNLLIENKGGLSVVDGQEELVLPLPIAGLMIDADGYGVAEKYTILDQKIKSMGSSLSAPFMTLSFMALLVIPEIKLSDKGLFDAERFRFIT